MIVLWLLAVALLLFAWTFREEFVDKDFPVTPPKRDSVWLSKIDAEAPIGGNDDDYLKVLDAFYTKVYVPAETKPTDAAVEAFLKSPDANIAGIDPGALRKIIVAGFRIESTKTAAAREEAQVKFKPSKALEPKDGVDEVFVRKEDIYQPSDTRKGDLPEGLYAPVDQQEEPRREGIYDDKSTSWSSASFYSICKPGEPCAKNVL